MTSIEYYIKISKKKLVQGSFILFIYDTALRLINIVLNIFLIRILEKEVFGEFTFFNSLVLLVISLITPAMIEILYRHYIENKSNGQNIGGEICFSSILITLVFIIISFIILKLLIISSINIFDYKVLSDNMLFYISFFTALTISISNIFIAYSQANKHFNIAGIFLPLRSLLFLFFLSITYYCINIKMDLKNIVLINYLSLFIVLLFYLLKIWKINFVKIKDIFTLSFILIKQYKLVFFYFLLLAVYSQADIFFVSYFFNNEKLADYGVAIRYYSLLLSFLPSLSIILKIKYFDKQVINDIRLQKKYAVEWFKITSLPLLIVYIFLFLLSPIVLPILNGPNYQDSIIYFRILSLGAILSYLLSPNIALLFAQKRFLELNVLAFSTVIINITINLLIVNKYGLIGITIVSVLSHLFLNGLGNVIFFVNSRKRDEY